MAVYLAEVHGFLSLFFYFFQIWAPRRRRCPTPSGQFTVDVFITTYNEDEALLRQTARAALALRYPHRTYLCDDGRRPEVEALARELGCGYITRADNRHAKAGNWNNAYAQTTGDLILTLDADHVAQPSLLERTIGYFEDPRVALVQVPQQYHNLDSVQHKVNWDERRMYGEQDVFFDLVMPGKDHWNAAFFCGTGAVLRRAALEPHGGIITGSITEDMHTAIVLHSEGWKSVYVNEILVTGLAPTDVASFLKQRLRWAEGNLKIIFDINPLTCRGLTVAQRLAYFASMFHWTNGLPKLVFYLAPPWMLVSGTFPIAPFDRRLVAIYLANLGVDVARLQAHEPRPRPSADGRVLQHAQHLHAAAGAVEVRPARAQGGRVRRHQQEGRWHVGHGRAAARRDARHLVARHQLEPDGARLRRDRGPLRRRHRDVLDDLQHGARRRRDPPRDAPAAEARCRAVPRQLRRLDTRWRRVEGARGHDGRPQRGRMPPAVARADARRCRRSTWTCTCRQASCASASRW